MTHEVHRGPAGVVEVDLRSDTVTRPTPAMREAIASAEVGDSVLGDDPTVNRLEAMGAELLGKEGALFFPSGTMANQTALLLLGRPGTEGLAEAGSHVLHYEEAGAAQLGGLHLRPVDAGGGLFTADVLLEAFRPPSPFTPEASLAVVENTHLASGGKVLGPEALAEIRDVAQRAGLGLHLDGARLWNAAAALGVAVHEWTRSADTVMVSLSKGLGAPVGSLLACSGEMVERARRIRRRLGGGMRQAGLLAAGGIHALGRHLGRLSEDHRRARILSEGLERLPGVRPVQPETNVVLVELEDGLPGPPVLVERMAEEGVLLVPFGRRRLRAVTHLDVDDDGIKRALAAFSRVLTSYGS